MPPLWPTSATGPARSRSGRSSVSVTRRLLAQMFPMQFGPETASPVSAITRGEFAAELGALGVKAFAEARREHRGAARARGRAAAQHFRHARRRHQDDEVIGRLGQRGEIRIAGRSQISVRRGLIR